MNKTNTSILEHVDSSLYDNKEVILSAIRVDNKGTAFKHASDRLKDDFEVVLCAAKQNGCLIKYASDNMKDNKELVLQLLDNSILCFRDISPRLLDDVDIIRKAIVCKDHQVYTILKHVSDRIKGLYDVVLEAVKNNMYNYQYASLELRQNKGIIYAAIKTNLKMVSVIPKSVIMDIEIITFIIKKNIEECRKKNFSLDFAKEMSVYKKISFERLKDIKFILKLLELDEYIMKLLSQELQNNKQFIIEAIKVNTLVYNYISSDLLKDSIFKLECYRNMNKSKLHELKDSFIHELGKIEDNVYNITFIKENISIIHLLGQTVIQMLLSHKAYEIFTKSEDLADILKTTHSTIIFPNSDFVQPEDEMGLTDTELTELQTKIILQFSGYKVIFI